MWMGQREVNQLMSLAMRLSWNGSGSLLVSPPLCSKLRYPNNFWMDCHKFLCRHSLSPPDETHWLEFAPSRFTFVVLRQMSQQLLDWLSCFLTFMFPSGLVISFVIPELFCERHHQVKVLLGSSPNTCKTADIHQPQLHFVFRRDSVIKFLFLEVLRHH